MARETADILFDVTGQKLWHRCIQGRPTSAAFKVFRDTSGDDSDPEFDGSASVDTVNTTLSSDAGHSQSDPNLIPLDDTSGIVTGRKYLLSEDGIKQWVEPIEVALSSVRVRHPLSQDFTDSATFVSTYLSVDIPDAWAADQSNLSDASDPNPDYRVRLAIEVDGETRIEYEFFDLVRGVAGFHVTIADVDARWPGLATQLPRDHRADQGAALFRSAWSMVRSDLAAIKLNDAAIRDHEAIDELVIRAAIKMLAEGGMHPPNMDPGIFLDRVSANYERWFEKHFMAAKIHPVAKGTTGASSAMGAASDFWSK